MKPKKYLFVFYFLFIILVVNTILAVPPFQTTTGTIGYDVIVPPFDSIKQDMNFEFFVHVLNKSDGKQIPNSFASCSLHIYNFAGAHVIQMGMVAETEPDVINEFALNIDKGNFTEQGMYGYIVQCNSSNIGGASSDSFIVSPSGLSNTLGFYAIIFGIALFLIILGFSIKDGWVTILGTFGLYFVGLYILLNGIEGVKNMTTTYAMAIIILGAAAYISVASAKEMMD